MPNPVTAPPGTTAQPTGTLTIPNIPTATDLPSALVAINVIGQAIALLAQNVTAGSGNTQAAASSTGGTFVQTDQVTQTVTLTDPNDSTVQVEVTQITGLTMRNPVTGETWVWKQA